MVTFAWFGRVGGSGLLEMTRIPPSDLLTDEKSLTTSAPQSQRRGSRCLGFVLVEANLLGMHLLPWRKPFGEAIPATPNLLVASETLPLVEKWGLIPPEPDVPLTLISLAPVSPRTSLCRRVRPHFFCWLNTVVTYKKRVGYAKYKV